MNGKPLLLRLLRHIQPYWKVFGVAVLAMVIFSLTQASIPALIQPLLDGTFVERDARYLFWAPIGIIALFAVRALANFVSEIAFGWVSSRVVLDLRQQMFQRYLQLPNSFFDHHTTGLLISRVTYDAHQVTVSANQALVSLVRDSLTIIGLVGYILYLNWRLSLVLGLMFPVVAIVIAFIAKRLRRLNLQLQQQYGHLTHILEEGIKGQREVKIFGGQGYETARFNRAANGLRQFTMKILVTSATNVPIVEILGALLIALIVSVSAAPGQHVMTVGEFMAFLTAFILLLPALKNLTKVNTQVQQVLAAAQSVFAAIDECPEEDLGRDALPRVTGTLRLEQVSFTHQGSSQPVLHQIDLELPAGSTVALVGQSGSGKSTIASLIPRFYQPSAGRILLDGQDTRALPLADLRRQISYVGQEVILFNDSIAANIGYGLNNGCSRDQIMAAARAAHAEEFILRMAEGYDTQIGENGVRLSGGQRQRIAIARALLKEAPILILDEATSALDNESEQQVKAALDALKGSRTTLVIAHRLSTIENANRIVVMDGGRIMESGTHQELLARNGLYSKLLQMQSPDNPS